MNGELGVRLGKGHWTDPLSMWQEGLPEGWSLDVRSLQRVVGMSVKVTELTLSVVVTAPSGAKHAQTMVFMDRMVEPRVVIDHDGDRR